MPTCLVVNCKTDRCNRLHVLKVIPHKMEVSAPDWISLRCPYCRETHRYVQTDMYKKDVEEEIPPDHQDAF